MGSTSRALRRTQARFVIGEYVAKKNNKKTKTVKVGGRSGALHEFWQKMQIDTHGYWPWRMNRVACDPKSRKSSVIFQVQYAGKR